MFSLLEKKREKKNLSRRLSLLHFDYYLPYLIPSILSETILAEENILCHFPYVEVYETVYGNMLQLRLAV